MPPESSIQHVSDTAYLIAEARAIESARPDALFRDPLAARLSGEKGKAVLAAFPRARITTWLTAVRTVIIDDYITAAVGRGVDTVLNLGAGLDTRPYRMKVPRALQWIEVDYPAVIDYKTDLLAGESPVCNLERFAVDLADHEARRAFIAMANARSTRTLVLTEGVVPYLDLDQAGALADDLRALHGVDAWIVDYISTQSHAYRQRAGVTRHMKQAPFKFRPPDWFEFFAQHGWTPREIKYLAIEGRRMGRQVPLPWVARVLKNFAPRKRRDAMSRFAGYALLEPATAVTAR